MALLAVLLAHEALPASAGPIETLAPGQWYEVPNSRLRAVVPAPTPDGWTGPEAIISAWNSAAYDPTRDRLYVLGGGHADYAGNEVYQFDLATLAWSRLTDPSPSWAVPQVGQPSSDVYADGKPASVHTYGAVQYLPNRDALWVMGGSRWHDGAPSNLGWQLNLQSRQWQQGPVLLPPHLGYSSAYDPVSGRVIIRGVTQTYSYNPVTQAQAAISADDVAVTGGTYDGYSAAIHWGRREFVVLGLGKLIVFNLDAPATAQAQRITMTGDTDILGAYAPGLDYDTARQVLVAWKGGSDVYEIDLAARAIQKVPSAGGAVPSAQQEAGTWGRWRYVPSRQVFIGVNSIDENVFVYKPAGAMPLRTWVARPLPGIGLGPSPQGSKHMRLAHNPVNGRLYLLGGDYSGLVGYDSGRNEVYSYSVADDTWVLEYPYCGPSGSVQPSHPDEVGWTYDTLRNIFWMTPGYMSGADGDPCPQNLVLDRIMTFNPATRTWTVPNRTAQGFGAVKFAVHDPVTDSIIRFTTNPGGPIAEHYVIATNTYQEYPLGLDPYDPVMRDARFGEEYYAIDVPGRVIWLIEPVQGRLYRYRIDQRRLEFVGNTPVNNPVPPNGADDWWPWDSSMPIWDSVNRVLLWPHIRDFSTANITLYIFHPDTGQWEKDAMLQPNGLPVRGNTAGFDPQQNVLVVLGGTYPANPYLFLYRYAGGVTVGGPTASPARLVTGAGRGGLPAVRRFNGSGAATAPDLVAYHPAFGGGLFVALGDVDGAGDAEIVTGAGPGGGPHVRVFRTDGSDFGVSFMAYAPAFAGGVRVATCDVDGDGRAEIVTGAGPGGGPHVRVFAVQGATVVERASFYAYDPRFAGGVFVACGDLDGDGRGEVITGADAGGGPHVRVFKLDGGRVSELFGFYAYDPAFAGGVRVAAGNLDGGDRAALITGAGPGGGPHVRAFKWEGGALREVASFYAYDPAFAGGVYVGAGRVTGGSRAEIVTGAGAGGGPHVRVFTGTGADTGLGFFAYGVGFTGGVTVATSP